MPAITGETASGRSIRLTSALPRNSRSWQSPRGRDPEIRFSGTAVTVASSVSRMAASASGSLRASILDQAVREPSLKMAARARREEHQEEQGRGDHGRRIPGDLPSRRREVSWS